MTFNLENALHGLQEARTALVLESGNALNTIEQEEALETMEDLIDSVMSMLNAY